MKPHRPSQYHRLDERVLSRSLAILGHTGLKAYLRSAEWREIETSFFDAQPRCRRCPKRASKLLIKSPDLDTLTGQRPERLEPLCADCFCIATWRPPASLAHGGRFIPAEESRALEQRRGETTFNRATRRRWPDARFGKKNRKARKQGL